MTIATILPTARTIFFDANGDPLAGGFVYMYVPPNTTTPKTTWQDALGATPNSNPIVLDADGSCLLYGSGQYLQKVYDSLSNLIYTGLTQDVYGLLVGGNNTITGNNTFSGTNTFSGSTIFTATPSFNQGSPFGGGLINKFRNGCCDVAQRATSGTITAGSPAYSLDGFIISCTGANVTWAQGGANTSANGQIFAHSLQITGATSVTNTNVKQRIEGSIAAPMATLRTIFQCSVTNNTGATITPTLTIKHCVSLDNFGSLTTDVNAVSLQPITNGGTATLSYTYQDANANLGLEATVDFAGVLNSGAKNITITAWDIRPTTTNVAVGLNSSAPPVEERPIPFELLFCQRYLFVYNSQGTTSTVSAAFAQTTTAGIAIIPLPVPLRSVVTGITVSAASHFSVNINNANVALAALTFSSSSLNSVALSFGSSGYTANAGCLLFANNASGQILFTGAEL